MIKNDFFVWVLAATAFLANPNAGCGADSESDDFTYGESEMRVAVEGEWAGTLEIDGEKQPLVVQLEQASSSQSTQGLDAPRSTQCGSRDFVKGAAACMSMTTMPVVGSVVLGSEAPVALSGSVMAFRTLETMELSFEAADGGGRYVGSITAGSIENGSFEHEALGTGSFALSR